MGRNLPQHRRNQFASSVSLLDFAGKPPFEPPPKLATDEILSLKRVITGNRMEEVAPKRAPTVEDPPSASSSEEEETSSGEDEASIYYL
ncbi:hypothetical protein SADUNF_Sadunf09G0071100 [Salix dunnii]|uniref:Uncharacterized protein n=1 Tax=Salix dunnii TaxID=1413687 RepID=A0A835MR32_9ROSI|nr:hypothetical protein SADUNF_Sadunf09G0071100 [Salix dunnii]